MNAKGSVCATVTGYKAYEPKDTNNFNKRLLPIIYKGRKKSETNRPKLLYGSNRLNRNRLPVNKDKNTMIRIA